jgi:hypothetical protein
MGLGKKLHLFLAKHNVLIHCLKSCEKYGCTEYHGCSPTEQISFYIGKGLTSFGTETPKVKNGSKRYESHFHKRNNYRNS